MRQQTSDRLIDFLEASVRIFTRKGYRRTQMSDVTDALGLSNGSIYRYVRTKEALFDLSLRHAIDPADAVLSALPYRVRSRRETIAYLRRAIDRRARIHGLESALEATAPGNPRPEFEGIVRELFQTVRRYGPALSLVERCALDWPDLASLWFQEGRKRIILQLERYLRDRAERGALRPTLDPRGAAGLLVAIVVFQAIKRHEDPYPVSMTDEVAEELAVEHLVNAYLGSGP